MIGVIPAGLAVSVGWGIRGDYGHEAGAMIPGALVGLAVCLASGRDGWWHRASIMGLCGAIGRAFGGRMSYGRIIGCTAGSSLPGSHPRSPSTTVTGPQRSESTPR